MLLSILNKRILFFFTWFIFFSILLSRLAFAYPNGQPENLIKKLNISQDKYKKGFSFISRPGILDEKIRNIIVLNSIESIEDYIAWLKSNISYKKDGKVDIWSPPQDTLRKRHGDCEDLAFLSAAFLKVAGFNPQIIGIVKRLNKKHAVCVFKKNGHYYWIDNFRLIKTPARTITELADYFFNSYNCYAVGELCLQTNSFKLIAKKL